jgi:pimeloyl-ACP methyl ester carboxylesterase
MRDAAGPRRAARPGLRARLVVLLACCLVVLSGCAGGLSQTFKQSLSVVVPEKVNFAELEYYAKRSSAAYDPVSQIRADFPLTTRAVTVTSVDVRYFIETDLANGTQTLSVRGTAAKPNVWEDVETALVPDNLLGIRLHRGFQRDAKAIFDDATPHLRKDLGLRITGHSLGGAVAAVLAEYYAREGYKVERLVTFGQPRIDTKMTPEDKAGLLAVTTRVVNDLDVVPMIPPYTEIRPYQHFSAEVILMPGPDYVYLDNHDADRLSIGDFWRNLTDFSAKDHHMDGYLANIKGKVANGAKQVPYLFKQKKVSPMVEAANAKGAAAAAGTLPAVN